MSIPITWSLSHGRGLNLTDVAYLLTLGVSWIAMAILTDPIGNFPINDDWAYAGAVRTLLEEGRFVLPNWAAMNLVVQVLWGTAASLLLGFSYTTLRLSSLVLGLGGVLTVYWIQRQLRITPHISFLNSSVLAVNPLYFGQSLTFMTDIPFLAFALLSVLYFIRALEGGRTLNAVLGAIAACLALLVRQTGLVLPFAFAIAFLFRYGISKRSLPLALLPLGTGIALQFCYQFWLTTSGRLPVMYGRQVATLTETLSGPLAEIIRVYGRNTSVVLITMGLCLVPALILPALCWFRRRTFRAKLIWTVLAGGLFALAVWLLLYYFRRQMPLLTNILEPYGLGPLLPHGSGWDRQPDYLYLTWRSITLISVAGGLVLLLFLGKAAIDVVEGARIGRTSPEVSILIFLICLSVAYCAPILGIPLIYDRYLIFLLPLALLMVAVVTRGDCESLRAVHLLPCLAAVLLYGAFTVAAAHDFLAWNRVRWQALYWLMDEHKVPPRKINGGLEFEGTYLYDPKVTTHDSKGRWWVKEEDEEFLIAFSIIRGYEPFRSFPVDRWLPFSPGQILILRKSGGVAGGAD